LFMVYAGALGGVFVMNSAGQDHRVKLLAIPRATVQKIVTGKPFQSRFISTRSLEDGTTEEVSGEMYRDSNGTVGIMYHYPSGEETMTLSDVVGQRVMFVDHHSHTVQIHKFGSDAADPPVKWAFANCIPTYTSEYRDILNIKSRRVMLRDSFQRQMSVGEIWLSEDLAIVMKDSGTADGVSRDWHITEIRLAEPSPILLQAPPGYQTLSLDDR
jgi:hypothetical protein